MVKSVTPDEIHDRGDDTDQVALESNDQNGPTIIFHNQPQNNQLPNHSKSNIHSIELN